LWIIWYFTIKGRKVLRPIILFAIKKDFYNPPRYRTRFPVLSLKVGGWNDDGGGITNAKRRKLWLM